MFHVHLKHAGTFFLYCGRIKDGVNQVRFSRSRGCTYCGSYHLLMSPLRFLTTMHEQPVWYSVHIETGVGLKISILEFILNHSSDVHFPVIVDRVVKL